MQLGPRKYFSRHGEQSLMAASCRAARPCRARAARRRCRRRGFEASPLNKSAMRACAAQQVVTRCKRVLACGFLRMALCEQATLCQPPVGVWLAPLTSPTRPSARSDVQKRLVCVHSLRNEREFSSNQLLPRVGCGVLFFPPLRRRHLDAVRRTKHALDLRGQRLEGVRFSSRYSCRS